MIEPIYIYIYISEKVLMKVLMPVLVEVEIHGSAQAVLFDVEV